MQRWRLSCTWKRSFCLGGLLLPAEARCCCFVNYIIGFCFFKDPNPLLQVRKTPPSFKPDMLDRTDSSSRHCKGRNSNEKVHLECTKGDKSQEWCSFRLRHCTWSGGRTHQKEQMNQHRSWSGYQREEKSAISECMPLLHANRILSLHFQYQEFSFNSLDRSLHKCLSWYIEFVLFKSVYIFTAPFYV